MNDRPPVCKTCGKALSRFGSALNSKTHEWEPLFARTCACDPVEPPLVPFIDEVPQVFTSEDWDALKRRLRRSGTDE